MKTATAHLRFLSVCLLSANNAWLRGQQSVLTNRKFNKPKLLRASSLLKYAKRKITHKFESDRPLPYCTCGARTDRSFEWRLAVNSCENVNRNDRSDVICPVRSINGSNVHISLSIRIGHLFTGRDALTGGVQN
jgi:hypothetical protein